MKMCTEKVKLCKINHGETTLKLEQSLELSKTKLRVAQPKLTRTGVALNRMIQERNGLRDTTWRLQAERDQMAGQMLQLNLEEIKDGCELANSVLKLKLGNEKV